MQTDDFPLKNNIILKKAFLKSLSTWYESWLQSIHARLDTSKIFRCRRPLRNSWLPKAKNLTLIERVEHKASSKIRAAIKSRWLEIFNEESLNQLRLYENRVSLSFDHNFHRNTAKKKALFFAHSSRKNSETCSQKQKIWKPSF